MWSTADAGSFLESPYLITITNRQVLLNQNTGTRVGDRGPIQNESGEGKRREGSSKNDVGAKNVLLKRK